MQGSTLISAAFAQKLRRFRILDRFPVPDPHQPDDDTADIVCPWMKGLPADAGPWVAALPIHDCNAVFEEEWHFTPTQAARQNCYFGVFMLDRLRSTEGLFSLLRRRGIHAIINFPSVTFFDGTTAQALGALGFDAEAEMRVLEKAADAGFRIGICGRADTVVPALLPRAELRLIHDGPGRPMSCVAT